MNYLFKNPNSETTAASASRKIVYFSLGDGNDDVKVLYSDELRLKHSGERTGTKPFECNGIVVKVIILHFFTLLFIQVPNLLSNEIGLEIKELKSKINTSLTTNFTVEFVWKSAPFDRMKLAMNTFAANAKNQCVSYFLQEKILGHQIDDSKGYSKVAYPASYKVPNLAELNVGQVYAINNALRNALTLIQGDSKTLKKTFLIDINFRTSWYRKNYYLSSCYLSFAKTKGKLKNISLCSL